MGWPQYVIISWLVLLSLWDILCANGFKPTPSGPVLRAARAIYLPLGIATILWAGGFWG